LVSALQKDDVGQEEQRHRGAHRPGRGSSFAGFFFSRIEDGNGQQEVRTVLINGEPWFVAKDVCEVLCLGNVTEALRGLDDNEI